LIGESAEWVRQAQYDLDTAEYLVAGKRYPPAMFFCNPALEKALKALYLERFNDVPTKTHNLVFLVEVLELDLPEHLVDPLIVINRLGVTSRYPHNFEKVLEQYTGQQAQRILSRTKEILSWLMQTSSKR
jgi:HEPN domain-containing protein